MAQDGIMSGNKRLACTWYKVKVESGNKYNKMRLLRKLLNLDKFHPIFYENCETHSQFYIESKKIAESLSLHHHFKITYEASYPPFAQITPDLTEKIKTEMCRRYSRETNSLDLSAFYRSFAGEVYAPLWMRDVLRKVGELIIENMPDVQAIDLSNNKIDSLDALDNIEFRAKVKKLQILSLRQNRLADIWCLETFKGLNLKELNCINNPFKYSTGRAYEDTIKSIFPKLRKLDNIPMLTLASATDEIKGKTLAVQDSLGDNGNGASVEEKCEDTTAEGPNAKRRKIEQDLASHQKGSEALEKKKTDLERDLADQREANAALHKELAQLQQQIQASEAGEKKKSEPQQELAKLQNELAQLQQEIQANKVSSDEEVAKLKNDILELEKAKKAEFENGFQRGFRAGFETGCQGQGK